MTTNNELDTDFLSKGKRVKRVYLIVSNEECKIENEIKKQLAKLIELHLINSYTQGKNNNPRYLTEADKKFARDFVNFTTVEIKNNSRYTFHYHTSIEFKHPETGETFDLQDFGEMVDKQEKENKVK